MGERPADHVMRLRERIAESRAQPGYHPYWASSPIVPDEPLWQISCRRRGIEDWAGPYRTATRDLDRAIEEAREYLRMPKRADVSVHPTVPRSDTYRGAKSLLTAMMLAVPPRHPAADEMFDHLLSALRAVYEAEHDGRRLSGLRVSLPIAMEVDEFKLGRPRSIKTVTWGDHGGDWPGWHRTTVQPVGQDLTAIRSGSE
jgi:hypothetical protein